MLVHFGADLIAPEWGAAVVCIGTFDGVHLGHQQVIKTAVARARQAEKPCLLVTFDRHPAAVLAPTKNPPTIATLSQNLGLFRACGVSTCVILRFDLALANVTAEEFLHELLVGKLRADEVVVGHDFAMGKGRQGTGAWLSERIGTTIVPPFEIDGKRVSSTQVREAIADGEVDKARALLGRPFGIEGVVVPGQKLGRRLGFPTINLARSGRMVEPANGIYAGSCTTVLGTYRAAVSIGVRPSVGGEQRTIEAFLIDYPGDEIYGTAVEVRLHARLRDEQSFDDLDAMTRQIAVDVERATEILSAETRQEEKEV
jgi:riboflavin kinase/FMN adenylyltransferase